MLAMWDTLPPAAMLGDYRAAGFRETGASKAGPDLSRDTHLQHRVDLYHIEVLTNDLGVMDLLDIHEDHGRVIVHIVIQALTTQGKADNQLSQMHLLTIVIDPPCSTRFSTPSEKRSVSLQDLYDP